MSNLNAQDLDWSTIIFVNGQRFAKDARLFGVEVPFHDHKLNGQELAQIMFVADFVQLAQAGVIDLSLSSSKMLFITTISVAVQKLKDIEYGSLNQAIVRQITGNAGKDNVKNIVYRVLGRDYADPYGVVAGWAKKDLLSRGYYRAEQRGAIAQALAGSKVIAIPDALSTLTPLADAVQNGLNQFQTAHAEIYKQMMSDTMGALRSRVERDTSTND
jgi:hypothetical protein